MQTISPVRSRWLASERALRCSILALSFCALQAQASTDLRTSEQDVLQGRADRAIAGLRSAVSSDPANAAAHLLLCRVFLSEQHGPEAAQECQLAIRTGLANNSDAQDWAGRAFGMEAEHAGPIAGLKLASQVRNAFQAAFRLNPRNPAAANDLGEYYINAPFIVGGGVDKASALADSIQATLPEIAHRLRALIAEKHSDITTAEREFVAAAAVANAPGALVDLSCFYVRQNMPAKGADAARRAIAQDHDADANIVDAASSLSDAHQTAQAIPILRTYLARGQQSDQAPAFRVHTLLGEMLAAQGDRANARKEFQQALALAAGYAPAQKGLGSL
jgi:Tfp pilus assembly protein PilF